MSRHRGRSDVASDSRKAADVAGLRERAKPVETQGHWNPRRGKLGEDEVFRPGKTARKRGRRRG